MWCPEGYYSWNYVLNSLFDSSSQILSVVALGGEPPKRADGSQHLMHTAEFYLKSKGFADGYPDAELIVSLTTCFLMSRFFEDYPPVLVNLNANMISVDDIFFEHKDQLSCCDYGWPLKSDPQFMRFFEYSKAGAFGPSTIFDRFAFVDPNIGEIRVKNGSREFLVNGVGCSDEETDSIINLAQRLSGYVVCWPRFPDEPEFRNFLNHLAINDLFEESLNYSFGSATETMVRTEKRRVGRPSKQDAARRAYWSHFPQGHEVAGKVWKEALAVVNASIGAPISEHTLKRAVGDGRQKQQ